MNTIEALNININKKQFISIVGVGGKTTLLYRLSRELRKCNKRILLSTTTHIFIPPKDIYDDMYINSDRKALLKYAESINKKGVFVIGSHITDEEKIKGIDISLADELYNNHIFDFILVEADGSKRKPIKAPANWEPMVPANTTINIGVIGLDSIGMIANEENVHRLDEFCFITQCSLGDVINEIMLAKLINHPQGLFKNTPSKAKKIVLLNKADNVNMVELGKTIGKMIETDNTTIIIASLENNRYWM
ncbi:MAG: putative selenium-dependent hydroxylase accessory protein YqeC [Clostridiales bacterium]|nr:putative selenium-dependent hydroxylase accessory protein YqeC [Clostridiales bacterium]